MEDIELLKQLMSFPEFLTQLDYELDHASGDGKSERLVAEHLHITVEQAERVIDLYIRECEDNE